MATYIVTYDLRAPGRNYDELYKRIRAYADWAHITESSWGIKTTAAATAIRDNLNGAIDTNDKLFVAVVTGPAAWSGLSEQVSTWLKQNL